MPHPAADPSRVGRLWADATTVQNTADALAADTELADLAISVFEQSDGRWLLELYFRNPPDERAVRAVVASAVGAEASHALAFETLVPTDWIKKSREGLEPVLAGRFAVHAAHDRSRITANRIAIEIEASLAFGTGHHGSTRGCLVALDRIARRLTSKARRPPVCSRRPSRGSKALVLDVGTGSGVLAIAAARALRRRILASDLDLRAITIARENVRLNRVGAYVEILRTAGVRAHRFRARGPYGLILANILLEPLRPMATPMARLLAPGGQAVLSGLLIGQANAALAAYRARGFALARRIICEGWATLVLVRRARRNP